MGRSIINTSLQGFNQGVSSIISYYFGCKDINKIKEILKIQLIIVSCFSITLVAIILTYTKTLVSFFIKDNDVLINFTVNALRINLCLMFFTAIFVALNSFFQAIKENKIATNFFLVRILILNIPLLYILPLFLKETGIWLAFPISDTIICILIVFYTSIFFKKNRYYLLNNRKNML